MIDEQSGAQRRVAAAATASSSADCNFAALSAFRDAKRGANGACAANFVAQSMSFRLVSCAHGRNAPSRAEIVDVLFLV